jgi:protein gp37
MGDTTKIEWCDATFNPWVGCQKVSPGCDRCYAEGWSKRSGMVQWGPHGERKRTSEANWRKPLKWAKDARGTGKRPRVFCASLADWLDNRAPQQWRIDLAGLIDATPELDWLLLTKRPENYGHLAPWIKAPSNVWIGVTAEDQAHYHRRWERIQDIPATVRFISYEPAIGPLMLDSAWSLTRLPHWIICGGESGHGARTMNPNWARDLRDVCASSGVAFFMKQMTGKAPIPDDLLVRQFPAGGRP